MELTLTKLRQLIIEELTADDKAEIRRMATKEAEKVIKAKDLKDLISKEVEKAFQEVKANALQNANAAIQAIDDSDKIFDRPGFIDSLTTIEKDLRAE